MSESDQPRGKQLDIERVTAQVRAEAFLRIITCHPGEFQNWLSLLNEEAHDGAYGMSAGAAALTAIDVNLAHKRRGIGNA